MKPLSLLILFSTIFTITTSQYLQINSPFSLRKYFMGKYQDRKGLFFKVGKVGELPFGKSISGFAHLNDHKKLDNSSNQWCKPTEGLNASLESILLDHNSSFIAIVDEGGCSLTTKAKHVQKANGIAMILVAKNENGFAEDINFDDKEGKDIFIPTLIIKASDGNKIKEELKSETKISLSMSFKAVVEGDIIEIELFMRSDEIKALHFFKEFNQYRLKLGDKLIFRPVYKYFKCKYCTGSDTLDATPLNGCIGNGDYCGGFNSSLQISNSRLVLLENIRQKCIYSKYKLSMYWKYMIKFSDSCADANLPTFTPECSTEVMKLVGIDIDSINVCMKDSITDSNKKLIQEDTLIFKKNKIFTYPQIYINKIPYKGSFYSKHVFNTICNGFMEHEKRKNICVDPDINIIVESNGMSGGLIVLIVLASIIGIVGLIYCYRRAVNKTIDESIEERIEKQAKDSMGHYSKMDHSSLRS